MKKDILRTCFTLGLVGAPFGVKGFVKIKSFSGETAHFSDLKNVKLKKDEKEEIREIAEIVFSSPNIGKASILMRFAGIESPEAAAALTGAEIIVGREFAAPLKKGQFYVEDLKGLEVLSPEGEILGRINDVLEGGGGYLAEVYFSGKKRLAPFRKEFFTDPDFEKGTIILLEPWV